MLVKINKHHKLLKSSLLGASVLASTYLMLNDVTTVKAATNSAKEAHVDDKISPNFVPKMQQSTPNIPVENILDTSNVTNVNSKNINNVVPINVNNNDLNNVPATGNIENNQDTWTLTGYGNGKYGNINYQKVTNNEAKAGTLSVVVKGVPHGSFGDSTYSEITAMQGDKQIYHQIFQGAKYYDVKRTIDLLPGDLIHIYYAEPGRLQVSDPAMKSTIRDIQNYCFQVAKDYSLSNITDYNYVSDQENKLFTNDQHQTLQFGISQTNVDKIKQYLDPDNKVFLTDKQRAELLNTLKQAQAILNSAPGNITLNQIFTKDIFGISDPTRNETLREGRYMGNDQDRQDLGVILTSGSTIKIRQSNTKYKDHIAVQLLGDASSNYQSIDVGNEWKTITAKENQVVYVFTPSVKTSETLPTVEYEIISGNAKKVPVFNVETNQEQVIDEWNNSRAPFALIIGNNFQIQVPYNDITMVQNANITNLINQYDNQVFKLYDHLTGIKTNTVYDHPVKGRYFIFGDSTGIGAGYWSVNYTAQNGNSVSDFLNINWLSLHEIAHGYEPYPSDDMYIIDSFNNIYGTIYQFTHPEDFKSYWIYSDSKQKAVTNALADINNHIPWSKMDYRERLMFWIDIAYNLKGENALINYNESHRQLALDNKPHTKNAPIWIQMYAQKYLLNVVPFFEQIGVPLDDTIKLNYTNLPAVALLDQVVSKNQQENIMAALGWTNQPLKSAASLVTNEMLQDAMKKLKIDLKGHVTLKLNSDMMNSVSIQVMNGDKVVTIAKVKGNTVELGTLPIGVYFLKSTDDNFAFKDPYLYVKQDGTIEKDVEGNATYLSSVKDLYTDNTYNILKDTVTTQKIVDAENTADQLQDSAIRAKNLALVNHAKTLIEQFNLHGLYGPFTTYKYLNNDGILRVQNNNKQPNYFYGHDEYMTLTITDSTGKITYKKVYYGDENVGKLAENIQLKAGDKITFSTKEGMKIDSVADLVGKQKYTFTFLVTPNLHLIRADENTKPIIIVPKKVIDLEAGTNFDPLASVTAQNGDGSQIKLTADNISSDINLNRGGFYHVIYHVIDKNGNVATERVTVQVTEPLTVHFVNADGTPVIENNSLIPEVKINGLAGQIVPVKYTIPNGWVIEKGQEIPTKYELHLNHNDIFIKIKHQIMNISTIDPKATKTIYRKIIFNFPDGKNKEITQNATFHRTVIKDLVTGILSYDNWNEESVKLPEVPVPNIAGYKANISKIGAESINATDSNKLINVNYIALLIENKNDEQEIKVTPLVKHAEVEKYDKNSADNSNTRVQNIDVDTRNKIRVNSVKSQSLQIYENKEIISAKNSNTMHKDSYKSLSIQKNAMINDRADKSKRDAHHNKVNNINSKLPQTGNKQNDESISIIGFIISSFTLLGWSKYWEKLIKKIEK